MSRRLGRTYARVPLVLFSLGYSEDSGRFYKQLMSINWIKDADEALTKAKQDNKPLLIDFSAAPS